MEVNEIVSYICIKQNKVIMSVFKYSTAEVAKAANTLEGEISLQTLWYAYVANTTAFNVQYQENEPLEFDVWDAEEGKMTREEAVRQMHGLNYNIYTNGGNCFMQEKNRLELEAFCKANPFD